MNLRENVPISSLTTMRLGGVAHYVSEITNVDDIAATLDFARERKLPVWFMGGGANTIGRDEGFAGVILLNQLKGIQIQQDGDEEVCIRAMAGELWDDLVAYSTDLHLSGIEAMSLIPGTVGAAPVQNIGAYGQDVAAVIKSVEAYDTKNNQLVCLNKSEMQMGYRTTRFNSGADAGRFFITSVTIALRHKTLTPPFYNSLQKYIDDRHITDFSPENIRRMVIQIRSEKLPDPKDIASAGSFFKNVYLNRADADQAEALGIPIWRTDDGGKINSGWLIEQCGLKGRELYGFRVSDKAALVLINEHAKSYADLAKARAYIIDAVKSRFGYILEQEPVELVV